MTGRHFDCTFCEILAGTRAARVVYEDDDTLAFLDRAPANPGHTLVVPRAHVIDLLDASPEQTAAVARAAQHVARLQLDRLAAHGVTLFQANRAAGWQDVFHLHVHVVPRYDGDKLQRPWTSNVADPAELQAAHDKLTS